MASSSCAPFRCSRDRNGDDDVVMMLACALCLSLATWPPTAASAAFEDPPKPEIPPYRFRSEPYSLLKCISNSWQDSTLHWSGKTA
ncbi:hypothetical protein L596_012374 [Steinernema carpocapsae]|uniref:Uncharacterized protein n=1 Tax=Steinernema carpocapsae TaxID=34508 RepID=A0A4U5NWZ6_STECR|nr:hypothetical protein L596_012374 [Steinernema carpocapsae]